MHLQWRPRPEQRTYKLDILGPFAARNIPQGMGLARTSKQLMLLPLALNILLRGPLANNPNSGWHWAGGLVASASACGVGKHKIKRMRSSYHNSECAQKSNQSFLVTLD